MNASPARFEDRLLAELKAVVDANPAPTGRPVPSRRAVRRPLALGGALATVGVAGTTAALLTGGTGAAYAVDSHSDGSVTVTIKSIKDAAGLQQKLNAAGVKAVVDYVPQGKMCARPRVKSDAGPSGKMTTSIRTLPSGGATFTISAGTLAANQTLVVESSLGEEPSMLGIQIVTGPVGACNLTTAPVPGSLPGGPGTVTRTSGPQDGQSTHTG